LIAQSQSTGSSLVLAVTGTENNGVIAEAPGAGIESTVATSPGPGTTTTVARGEREDLTVFFSIGIVIDVILLTAFLVWAVGQWRKAKK